MRLTIDDIVTASTYIKNELSHSILERFKENIKLLSNSEDKFVFDVQGKSHFFIFKQVILPDQETIGLLNEGLEIPVREIECNFNGHPLNSIYITSQDVENNLSDITEIVPLFLCTEILKLCFRKWYEPNISAAANGFSLPGYNNFVQTFLKPLGYSTSLSWDGRVFNFSIFAENEFEVIAQVTAYTNEHYVLQEETFLANIKNIVHDVFLELFRAKKINANISIEL